MTLKSLSWYVSGPSVPVILRRVCCSTQCQPCDIFWFIWKLLSCFSALRHRVQGEAQPKRAVYRPDFSDKTGVRITTFVTDTFRGMTAQPWLHRGQCDLLDCERISVIDTTRVALVAGMPFLP